MEAMAQKAIEALLEQRIGLAPDSLGGETVLKAVARRIKSCGVSDPEAYLRRLRTSPAEWEALLELVVVPETWFFRNKESFAFLTRQVRSEWLQGTAGSELRVLSVPCASGEEPYSVAMALADTGLEKGRLAIEAMDISPAALDKARQGIYGPESFRGKNLSFRDRYFDPVPGGHRLDPGVKGLVRFQRANLMDQEPFADMKPFDVIFCRNLLIYLSERGKERALAVFDRLLKPDGLLFVGHVERSLVRHPDFEWIKQPGVFACRRTRTRSAHRPATANRPKPERGIIRPAIQRPHAPPTVSSAPSRPAPPPLHSSVIGPPSTALRSPSPPRRVSAVEDDLERAQRMADQGKMEDAFRLCEKSVGENAFHIRAHFLMGLICHAMDDEERAEEAFNKAVYLDPAHHEAMSHLAFIMEHRGEREKADRMRRRAQRIREKEEGL